MAYIINEDEPKREEEQFANIKDDLLLAIAGVARAEEKYNLLIANIGEGIIESSMETREKILTEIEEAANDSYLAVVNLFLANPNQEILFVLEI